MKLKPSSPGLRVHHPGQPKRFLAAEGEHVDAREAYWRRRLRDGDVVQVGSKPERVADVAKSTKK